MGLQSIRSDWFNKIVDMDNKLTKFENIPSLQVETLTEWQSAVDSLHKTKATLIKLTFEYKAEFNKRYDYYMYQSQIKLKNEKEITRKIESELSELGRKKALIENQYEFLEKVIKGIDNTIWAIKDRIKLHEIMHGKGY